MKFEIKNNKIYRRGEEIKPDTSGTNGKVVSGMSAHGLWFSASTSTEKITIYKNDIIDLAPNAHEVFMSYIIWINNKKADNIFLMLSAFTFVFVVLWLIFLFVGYDFCVLIYLLSW